MKRMCRFLLEHDWTNKQPIVCLDECVRTWHRHVDKAFLTISEKVLVIHSYVLTQFLCHPFKPVSNTNPYSVFVNLL